MMSPKPLHVGIVGAGMGGLAAAIALVRGGVKVTVLEAATELGEIGAGIQIFPNVSRYLIRWDVDEIIGDNLVSVSEVRTWGTDGQVVTRVDTKRVKKLTGFPHWIARRDHLHAGLTESARRHGVEIIVGARVQTLSYTETSATATTTKGTSHTFDLIVGADGMKSTIRQHLFPETQPRATSKVAAYRGVLTIDEIMEKAPEAKPILTNTMDMWTGPNGYIMTYPLSGGKELNVVTSFCKDYLVTKMEEVDIDEFHAYYRDYSPAIQSIIKLVNYTQRWPLLTMPVLKSWSNEHKNVVLLGDSCHCMQNHMGQGAATAIEDGVFLGRVLSEVVHGVLTLSEAVSLYEQKRMPRVWTKQQVSFVSGELNMCSDKQDLDKRNRSSLPEVAGSNVTLNGSLKHGEKHNSEPGFPILPPSYRSWQMFSSIDTVPSIFYYDAEADADNAVFEFLQSRDQVNGHVDEFTMVSRELARKCWRATDFNGIPDG
jgi:salicylate hydroxylase